MRLPAFTTRRLMVLVALVGCATAGAMAPTRARLRRAAAAHGSRETHYTQMIQVCAMQGEATRATDVAASGRLHKSAASYARLAAFHAALKEKYEHAARYPWLPVPPDPPPPK